MILDDITDSTGGQVTDEISQQEIIESGQPTSKKITLSDGPYFQNNGTLFDCDVDGFRLPCRVSSANEEGFQLSTPPGKGLSYITIEQTSNDSNCISNEHTNLSQLDTCHIKFLIF